MFDPITALAPGADCQTYAIGSVNAVPHSGANADELMPDTRMDRFLLYPCNQPSLFYIL